MSTLDPLMADFVASVEAHTGQPGRRTGKETLLLCPGHDDHHRSLNVRQGDDGRPLVQCRSRSCTYEDICRAIGREPREFMPSNGSQRKRIVATYDYTDEAGELLFQVVRYEPKDFRQRRPDGKGDWIWKLANTRRVLFRLPQVRAAIERGEPIVFVEGEKDVLALESAGLTATCNPMGAGKWNRSYIELLRDAAEVWTIPDDDDAGRAHALTAAVDLARAGVPTRFVQLFFPVGETRRDVSDWLAHAYTPERREQAKRVLIDTAQGAHDDGTPRCPFIRLSVDPDDVDPDELSKQNGETALAPAARSTGRALPGGEFILDQPSEAEAVWGGASGNVAWAKGEGLMLVGPEGVGKTTLMQQLVLARIGLRKCVFGMRVEPADKPVLYIAADRPRQAQRSFARMVREEDRELLNERLIVWKGPLEFDLAEDKYLLRDFVLEQGAGTVFIDSLKDVALDLTKDEVGSRVNAAFQEAIAAGIEPCTNHHQRKQQQGGAKPKKLADVYGSRWLTAGMGSVFVLWGDPGDLVVEFNHLKQPAEEIGPWQLLHDHDLGETTICGDVDLLALAAASPIGITAYVAAVAMFHTDQPDRNEIEKARRRLDKLVKADQLRPEGEKPNPISYFATQT